MRIDSEKTGDGGWSSVPEAIKLPDGRIRIFYVSGDFEAMGGTMSAILPPPPNAPQKSEQPQGIYSFISDDGLTFGDQQPVIQEGGVYDPSIVRLSNDTYRVFYGEDIGGQAGQPNIVTKSITGRLR